MAWKGIKHASVGSDLGQDEWESEESHDVEKGTTAPVGASDGDVYFNTADKHYYVYQDVP